MDFGRVWGGFWEGVGRSLEALGVSWVTFWRFFVVLLFPMLSERALGALLIWSWFDFGWFGRGLGMFLEAKFDLFDIFGLKKIMFFLFLELVLFLLSFL